MDTLDSVCITVKTVRLLIKQVSRTEGLVSVTDLSELQNRLALTVLFSVTSRTRWPPNDPCSAVGIGILLALCGRLDALPASTTFPFRPSRSLVRTVILLRVTFVTAKCCTVRR